MTSALIIYKILAQVTGWSYFMAWNISFYPQIYTNFKLKSVSGFSMDNLLLNFLGYASYCAFTCTLYWNSLVRREYIEHVQTKKKDVPVVANDVAFAIHAMLATMVLTVQVFIYDRGSQKVSKVVWFSVISAALFLVAVAISAGFGSVEWYWFISMTGYVKLGVSWTKELPQIYLNFKRRSTYGYPIEGVSLDFLGGALSITQQLIYCLWYNDNEELFGNIPKFCLATQSLLLNVVYFWQHYVFFHGQLPRDLHNADAKEEKRKLLSEKTESCNSLPACS